MTQPKKVSAALTTMLENPLVQTILDRTADIRPVIDEVKTWWGYDLMARRPSPAYDEYGIFKGTDLDLACFLYSLTGRGAVLNIPTYKGHSQRKIRADQVLTSKENRHGRLVNVGANKDFFSFNISIIDENVVGEDTVGAIRTFSLTDKTGGWYDGWKQIQFVPTLKENRFITENKMWSGSKIYFKNFIHPNRWTSVFGKHYVITRMLMDRLEEEAKHLQRETKRLEEAGVKFPPGEGPKPFVPTEYGDTISKKFTAFEMSVYIPVNQYDGQYPMLDLTPAMLASAYQLRKYFLYSAIPQLRFMTRASEFAHYTNPDRFPTWMKNVKWEDGFKIPPRGRTQYQRLKLFQDKVGEHSISLLKRTYEKSAKVSAE